MNMQGGGQDLDSHARVLQAACPDPSSGLAIQDGAGALPPPGPEFSYGPKVTFADTDGEDLMAARSLDSLIHQYKGMLVSSRTTGTLLSTSSSRDEVLARLPECSPAKLRPCALSYYQEQDLPALLHGGARFLLQQRNA